MTALTSDDRALLRQAITHARAEGWRPAGERADRGYGEWKWSDDQGRTVHLRNHVGPHGVRMTLTGGGIDTQARIGRTAYAVEQLVAAGWLPEYMSGNYRQGYASGRDGLSVDIGYCAELGDDYRNTRAQRDLDVALVDARTYWLNKLDDRAWHLRDLLAGLLDQDGYVARRQADDVVGAVTEVLEAADV